MANIVASRSKRNWLIACCIVFVLVVAIFAFIPESYAAYWHLRHGNSITVSGIQMNVPFGYFVSGEGNNIALFNWRGRVRKVMGADSASIFVDARPRAYITNKQAFFDKWAGIVHTNSENLKPVEASLGKVPADCREYQKAADIEVICITGDPQMIISYEGAPGKANDFYAVMRSAH